MKCICCAETIRESIIETYLRGKNDLSEVRQTWQSCRVFLTVPSHSPNRLYLTRLLTIHNVDVMKNVQKVLDKNLLPLFALRRSGEQTRLPVKTLNDTVVVYGAEGRSARSFLECDMKMGLQPSAESSRPELPRRPRAWLRPARPTVLAARVLGDNQGELQPSVCDTHMLMKLNTDTHSLVLILSFCFYMTIHIVDYHFLSHHPLREQDAAVVTTQDSLLGNESWHQPTSLRADV